MKKVITLCAFAVVMVLVTMSASAQMNKEEINALAIEKTESLQKQINLDKDQLDAVHKVFVMYISKKTHLTDDSEENPTLMKLNNYRDEQFKEILSGPQYERYLKIKDQY